MRLWSIHPKYLDVKGLLAVWREGLLAKSVLEGKTRGYVNHPQLIRFRKSANPLRAINAYLYQIYLEAVKRGYDFKSDKITPAEIVRVSGGRAHMDFKSDRIAPDGEVKIPVNRGQVEYEFLHLMKKLRVRDRKRYLQLRKVKRIEVNPIFKLRRGGIEAWERADPRLARLIMGGKKKHSHSFPSKKRLYAAGRI